MHADLRRLGRLAVGLSSIDGFDASENTTTGTKNFEAKHWYKIKVRVTKERIEAWIDNDKIVTYPQDPDDKLEKHKIGIRFEVEPSVPLGISTYYTSSALRNIRWRNLD